MQQWRFEAIGTQWQIDTVTALTPETRGAVDLVISEYDAAFSRFRADSTVTRAGSVPGKYHLPPAAEELSELYWNLYQLSDGAFSPLVGSRLSSLGYDSEYSLTLAPSLAEVPGWEEALRWDGQELETLRVLELDVGAAGKGQLVDLVSEELREHGYEQFLVDASGDIRISTTNPSRVALEHPYQPELAIGVAEISQGSICASASNRRVWGDGFHHILNGQTGNPVQEVLATWVIARHALEADALATTLFVCSPELLATSYDFASARVFADGRAEVSQNFPGELFS